MLEFYVEFIEKENDEWMSRGEGMCVYMFLCLPW